MDRAKVKLLQEIARQFQVDYSGIHTSLTEDAEILKQKAKKIQQLRTLYTVTDEFPVWPFDLKTFRRYIFTVPTPLIPILIGLLQKFLVPTFK
jgi:hypothetical protein